MSGDCTESTLNFLFSGVFVGEFFLLKHVLVVFFSQLLKSSFFLGDSILMSDIFLSGLHCFGDIEGLFVFCGIKYCCTTNLAGEDLGVTTIFFKLAGELEGDFKLFFLIGDD